MRIGTVCTSTHGLLRSIASVGVVCVCTSNLYLRNLVPFAIVCTLYVFRRRISTDVIFTWTRYLLRTPIYLGVGFTSTPCLYLGIVCTSNSPPAPSQNPTLYQHGLYRYSLPVAPENQNIYWHGLYRYLLVKSVSAFPFLYSLLYLLETITPCCTFAGP